MIRLATSDGVLIDPTTAPTLDPEVARQDLLDQLTAIYDQLRYLAHQPEGARLKRFVVMCEFENTPSSELYLAGGRHYPDANLLLMAEDLRAFALEGPRFGTSPHPDGFGLPPEEDDPA